MPRIKVDCEVNVVESVRGTFWEQVGTGIRIEKRFPGITIVPEPVFLEDGWYYHEPVNGMRHRHHGQWYTAGVMNGMKDADYIPFMRAGEMWQVDVTKPNDSNTSETVTRDHLA
jgi:hypothetical protein